MDLPFSFSAQEMARLIPLTVALCCVCQSSGVWAICPTCQRVLCPACQPSTMNVECRGCTLDEQLLESPSPSPSPPSPFPSPSEVASCLLRTGTTFRMETTKRLPTIPESEEAFPAYPIPGQTRPSYITVEKALETVQAVQLPSEHQWQHAEHILQEFLYFGGGDTPQKPIPYTRYLVGRFVYPNSYPVLSDYMLSYEENSQTGNYEWKRYVSTFYDVSPCPYDVNLFFPAPLPLHIF